MGFVLRTLRSSRPPWANLLLAGAIGLGVWPGCLLVSLPPEPEDTLARTEFYFADVPPETPGNDAPLYLELDRLHQEQGWRGAVTRINEVQGDPNHIPTYALWLRDQYMYGGAPDPLYGLVYFEALKAANTVSQNDMHGPTLQDTVIMMVYVSSQLLAIENVARCAEKPNGTKYRFHWLTEQGRGQYARQLWDRMTAERRAFALRFAKARVESAEARPPNPTACAAGMDATIKAMDAGLCKRVPAAEVPNADEYVGGSQAEFMDCDSERFATFVDDATWVERRTQVRQQYWDQLFSN